MAIAPILGMSEAVSLSATARSRGLIFGTEVTQNEILGDDSYRELVTYHADIITPGLEAKWGFVEPAEDRFSFGALDSIADFTTSAGLRLHMHNVVWSVGLPAWTAAALSQGRGRAIMQRHIERVAGRYRGRVTAWDVVNEPVDPRWPSGVEGLCNTPWRRFMGPDFVGEAMRLVNLADPSARLLINDDDLEYDLPDREAKRTAYLRLIDTWLHVGIPLHGFGLEAHLKPWLPFAEKRYRRFLTELADFGLKLYITEFDVCDRTLPPDLARRDRAVACCAKRFLDTALDEKAICAVMTWGLSDRYTYMNRDATFCRADGLPSRPCAFDDRFLPKPLYHALASSLRNAPQREHWPPR